MILHGDCLDVMASMEPESIDAIVTDPPYGLEFMGKEWDRLGGGAAKSSKPGIGDRPTGWVSNVGWNGVRCRNCGHLPHGGSPCVCEAPDWRTANRMAQMQEWHSRWAEAAYRVAKPSAYLLAFGGTRTVHRMTVALEDAGWIIRDMLVWGYASGFPKSKASLKPAWEPIVMARKPGPLRMLAIDATRIPLPEGDAEFIAARVGSYHDRPGPPAINVGSRDPTEERTSERAGTDRGSSLVLDSPDTALAVTSAPPLGRWPANIVLTDPIFDGGIEGVVGGGESASGGNINGRPVTGYSKGWADERWFDGYSDGGTYSRYFLIPKAARSDREPVLGGLPLSVVNITEGHGLGPVNTSKKDSGLRENRARSNVHPTVKPTDLMRHLVRLVTPAGGTVLDPFLGSGTTALAAEMEGFDWIGIEREAEYVAIAEARLNGTQRGLGI